MEKKEMSFIEKFAAAGKELEKEHKWTLPETST